MNLIFAEAANRNQCGGEISINDLVMPCTFSSSKTVTIPAGLRYAGGTLELSDSAQETTLNICRNHEVRLRAAFDELLKASDSSNPSA